MQTTLRALLLFLLLSTHALASAPVSADNSVMTMRIDGEIAIDAAGKVIDYRITTPIEGELKPLLDKSVRRWTFHPVLVDSKPVQARSSMRITLAAQAVQTGYRVIVDNVTFGADLDSAARAEPRPGGDSSGRGEAPILVVANRPMPAYPRSLAKAGVEGAVLVGLKLTSDGNIENMIAVQSTLFNVRGRDAILAKARELFEDATLRAIKHWKFSVPDNKETPTASELSGVIRVVFKMPKTVASDAPGQWQVELRSEKRIAPWLRDTPAQSIGVSDLGDGEMQPVASAFRAPEGVIGRAL